MQVGEGGGMEIRGVETRYGDRGRGWAGRAVMCAVELCEVCVGEGPGTVRLDKPALCLLLTRLGFTAEEGKGVEVFVGKGEGGSTYISPKNRVVDLRPQFPPHFCKRQNITIVKEPGEGARETKVWCKFRPPAAAGGEGRADVKWYSARLVAFLGTVGAAGEGVWSWWREVEGEQRNRGEFS